jgi:hypothetical protein
MGSTAIPCCQMNCSVRNNSFAAMARAHSGCEVWQQDFLKLELPEKYSDGVFANATLFHVSSESDWNMFLGHAAATLAKFQVPDAEQRDVVAFVQSLKKEIVE